MKKEKVKTTIEKKDWKKMLIDLENKINFYVTEKAPQLPEKVKLILVKINPYLILISVVFSVPAILVALGLGAVLAPIGLWKGVPTGFQFSLGLLMTLVVMVLEIMALPGLFKNKRQAWELMFYTTLINAVYALVTLSLGSLIIGTAISWYFWFQIREYYKK
jgi:hypothetical protein